MSHDPYSVSSSCATYSGAMPHGPAVTRTGIPGAVSTRTWSSGQVAAAVRAVSKSAGVSVRGPGRATARPAARSRTTTRVRVPSVSARCSSIGWPNGVISLRPSPVR
ncbi:hypothetical protein OG897_30195 [Streptomyces sp. NBC_00237]|uniref:hypothetical protein n=1 Tax=Streptomyces sp. NBC_00237 TaxID=2975687 RepID=UPI002255E652|nr:hypothetical protein [Streptomyces sp. NBC_00237]MCX5205711.1 hypothetical protein [Streptomyces sp. NBC_00237]